MQVMLPQWINVLLTFSNTFLRTVLTSLCTWHLQPHRVSIRRFLLAAFARNRSTLSLRQRRFLSPPTGIEISRYCSRLGLPHTIDAVTSSTLDGYIHFIGAKPSERANLFLYIHGGGYTSSISANGHLPFALRSATTAGASLAVLEYALSPEAKYPTQLIQTVAAVKQLLKTHSPGRIIMGGDSAGAHLILSVLAHIISPSPYAPVLDLKGERFQAIYLLSPFVSIDLSADSYTRNAHNDMLTKEAVIGFINWFEPVFNEAYADPISAKPGFWKDLPVSRLLIVAGTWEVFYDDITAFATRLKGEVPERLDLQYVEGSHEIHVAPVLDILIKEDDGEMAKATLTWLEQGKVER